MGGKLERAGGFVVGIVLFVFGFALLQPGDGIVQTGVTIALAAVLTSLGIGVIAAAALPHSLEVSGERFKPLGLDVKASGGAAVFLLTLGFIYYMKDAEGAAGAVPQQPDVVATETAAGNPAHTQPQSGTEAAPELAGGDRSAPPPAALALDNPALAEMSRQLAPQAANYYLAWTWCSTCCPQGPDYCAQVGIGEGATPQQAASMATQLCAQNGGYPETCAANVEYVSASDLGF